MAIRGRTANVATDPVAAKDSDDSSAFVPSQAELRNGRRNDFSYWQKRPGYALDMDLGVKERVHGIFPDMGGLAVTDKGKVFQLHPKKGPVRIIGTAGRQPPTAVTFEDETLIASGERINRVLNGTLSGVSGAPQGLRYIVLLNGRIVGAGHDGRFFEWSNAGVYDTWDATNRTSIETSGEKIQNLKTRQGRLWIWADKHVEVWDNVGGNDVFQRSFRVERGTVAPESVVEANNTFYWFGDNEDFCVMGGSGYLVISGAYTAETNRLKQATDVYGIDYPLEKCVRWYSPSRGKCFVFDYKNSVFSEDGGWNGGQWTRMNIRSGALIGGRMIVGDYEPTGRVYEWSDKYRSDDGAPIRVYRRFNVPLTVGGSQARVNRIAFRVKVDEEGTSPPSDASFWARYRFDRGPWSQTEEFALVPGESSEHDPYFYIDAPGSGREIEIEVVESDAVDFLVTHVSLTVRQAGR